MAKSEKFSAPMSFRFDRSVIGRLRNGPPETANHIKDILIPVGKTEGSFVSAWNQYLTCIVRIDETLEHINTLNFYDPKIIQKQTFTLYECIMHCDVVIKSIEILSNIFKINTDRIKNSNVSFGNAIFYDSNKSTQFKIKTINTQEKGNDHKFWEYIRSVTTIHPANTTRSNFIDNLGENYLHTSPYMSWNKDNPFSPINNEKNLILTIWRGKPDSHNCYISLDTDMIQKYVVNWLSLLPLIEKVIETMIKTSKEELRQKRIKTLDDFDGDWNSYLVNIKLEYNRRYNRNSNDDSVGFLITEHVRKSLDTKFVDPIKQKILTQYNNLLKKEVIFFHQVLQNMNIEGCVIHTSYVFDNFSQVVGNLDLNYEFSKLDYIHDISTEDPNEDYYPTEKIKGLFENIGKIRTLPIAEQPQYFKTIRVPEPCYDEEWGRTMAIRIGELLIKDWFPIDYDVNDWQLYLQIVLAFFVKSNLYSKEIKEEV
ncbi:MAG: hypothetical protein RBR50_03855 [Candidatus Izemoplasmatales bacterium]|jgi:hypothetical protein|nr:hypothetical protein [Candidatus Izemoplasmatales bacterium]